jgi:hypothetical protein
MRAMGILFLSFVLLGCSKSRVEVFSRKPPAGWHGNYILSPDKIEPLQANAYSQILFLAAGRAQILAFDKAFAGWGWSASLSAAPTQGRSFALRCESLILFRTEGQARIVYRQIRGETGKYLVQDAATKEVAGKILEGSERLKAVVPKPLLTCEDSYLEFHPEVRENGQVVLVTEDNGFQFHSHDSESFRALVKRLPEVAGKLDRWDGAHTAFSRAEGEIYESPSNRYLPLPQTHRFYLPPYWKAQTQASGTLLKGTLPLRPPPSAARTGFGVNEFLYNLIERGEWVVPTANEARLYRTENGAERALGLGRLSADGLEISTDESPKGLRMEVEYKLGEDTTRVLVQTMTFGEAGERIAEPTVELRQK